MTNLQKALQTAAEKEADKFIKDFVVRLGRKPLPEGEARFERTTIRWKPEEIDVIKNVANDAPIGETIRELALEAAAARLKRG